MVIVGTCLDFCPRREIEERTRNRQMHPVFERSVPIKKYRRPAAGQNAERPEDVRPPKVLLDVTEHLFGLLLAKHGNAFSTCYPFVWDRLWAVRQDLTYQQLECHDSRKVLARCVRFHAVSAYLCRMENASLAIFDAQINEKHLTDTLHKLISLYEHHGILHENRPEMESLLLLWNLHSPIIVMRALELPEAVKMYMEKPIKIAKAIINGNMYRALSVSKNLDCVQFCAAENSLSKARIEFLQILNTAFGSKNCSFPITVLASWLNTDVEHSKQLLNFCGCHFDKSGNVGFSKVNQNSKFACEKSPRSTDVSFVNAISDDLAAILLI